MPSAATVPIVVDHLVGAALGAGRAEGVHVVPRPARRARGLGADEVLDALEEAGPQALVLALPPWVHPQSEPLPVLARVADRELLWLPARIPAAAWAVRLIAGWARSSARGDLIRRAQVLMGLADASAVPLPRRQWGEDGPRVPAVGPRALARWCDCAWARCDCCPGGGLRAVGCPSCGRRPLPE